MGGGAAASPVLFAGPGAAIKLEKVIVIGGIAIPQEVAAGTAIVGGVALIASAVSAGGGDSSHGGRNDIVEPNISTPNIQDCYRPWEGALWGGLPYHRFIWFGRENIGYGLSTREDRPWWKISWYGKVKRESKKNIDWGYHCVNLTVSADQMSRLRQEIASDKVNPPYYHLRDFNCHDWVSDILKRSGIKR